MKKIDAAAMKEQTLIAKDKYENEISHLMTFIDQESRRGLFEAVMHLSLVQVKKFEELGYEISEAVEGNGEPNYIISWR